MTKHEVITHIKEHPWMYDMQSNLCLKYWDDAEDQEVDIYQYLYKEEPYSDLSIHHLRHLIKNGWLFRTKKEALAFRKYIKEYKYLRGTKK